MAPPSPLRRVPLGDDGELIVRATTSEDADRLETLFDALPFEDRYLRFFSAFHPDESFVQRLAMANERGAVQLIALIVHTDGSEDVIGEAGSWPLANGNGELGITIAEGRRGWIGPYLLDALTEAAAVAGVPNLEADVLVTNRRMLAALRARGLAVTGHDGYSSVRVVISTSRSTPSWARSDERPRVLVEAPGGRWSAEDEARHHPWQIIVCPGPKGRPPQRPCPALTGERCPLAAEADAIVVHLANSFGTALTDAHATLHAGVPVCVQTKDDTAHPVHLTDRVSAALAAARNGQTGACAQR